MLVPVAVPIKAKTSAAAKINLLSDQITVAVDAMGGDHGPGVIVEGAINSARKWGTKIILVGDTDTVQAELAEFVCTHVDVDSS